MQFDSEHYQGNILFCCQGLVNPLLTPVQNLKCICSAVFVYTCGCNIFSFISHLTLYKMYIMFISDIPTYCMHGMVLMA